MPEMSWQENSKVWGIWRDLARPQVKEAGVLEALPWEPCVQPGPGAVRAPKCSPSTVGTASPGREVHYWAISHPH